MDSHNAPPPPVFIGIGLVILTVSVSFAVLYWRKKRKAQATAPVIPLTVVRRRGSTEVDPDALPSYQQHTSGQLLERQEMASPRYPPPAFQPGSIQYPGGENPTFPIQAVGSSPTTQEWVLKVGNLLAELKKVVPRSLIDGYPLDSPEYSKYTQLRKDLSTILADEPGQSIQPSASPKDDKDHSITTILYGRMLEIQRLLLHVDELQSSEIQAAKLTSDGKGAEEEFDSVRRCLDEILGLPEPFQSIPKTSPTRLEGSSRGFSGTAIDRRFSPPPYQPPHDRSGL